MLSTRLNSDLKIHSETGKQKAGKVVLANVTKRKMVNNTSVRQNRLKTKTVTRDHEGVRLTSRGQYMKKI